MRKPTMGAGSVAMAVLAAAACVVIPAQPAVAATLCEAINIVTHPDDDLLFLNPDIDGQIASGRCSATVYVTAGNGEPPVTSRQAGELDAYRTMAGVADQPDQTEWDSDWTTIAGVSVQRFTLSDRPDVQLMFLHLGDGQMKSLVDGSRIDLIDPATSQSRGRTINLAGARRLLLGVLAEYGPTTVRLQDTVPDSRYGDHADHTATSNLVREAVHDYRVQTGVAANLVYYHDYDISHRAVNLTPAEVDRKHTLFTGGYLPHNPKAAYAADAGWTNRTYYRWARGTGWVGRNADGTLEAFVVRDGEVFSWYEQGDDTWAGPVSLGRPGGGLYPAVSVSTNADGRLQIFGRGADHGIHTLWQTAPGGSWSDWFSMGNPNAGMGNPDQVGTPVAAVNADGRMQIFVRNGGGGVSSAWQTTPNGTWGDWTDFGGENLQDPVAAVTHHGLIEVFGTPSDASATNGLLWWRQDAPNGQLVREGTIATARTPASPPSVGFNQDGRIEVQYRAEGGGVEIAVGQPDESWGPASMDGPGGIGQPSLVTSSTSASDGRILAVTRNTDGGVSLARQAGPNLPYGSWEDLGGLIVDYPVATTDSAGRVVILAVGLDANLWINRQPVAGPTAGFPGWVRA